MNGSALISGYFDGTLSDAEVAELQAWIIADAANAKLFAKHAIVHQQLSGALGSERLLRLANKEQTDERTSASTPSTEFQGASRWLSNRMAASAAGARHGRRWRIVYGSAAAAAAILVICGVVAWKQFAASALMEWGDEELVINRSPAFITEEVGTVWKDSADEQQSDLAAGKTLTMVAGYVELTFANGARVVVEGPATFTIDSSRAMTLQSGKLVATVEGGGFVVTTPGAKVSDLGTEFGVAVRDPGVTAVEVFKGRVTVQGSGRSAGPAAATQQAAHTLNAGDGAIVQDGIFKTGAPGGAGNFVRHISAVVASLDVVDLMCGGDGMGHRRGVGIDVATGESGNLQQVGRESSDALYHRITGLSAVDGCFIPSRQLRATQVDSVGDAFKFPVTSNLSQGLLSAGGRPLDPYGRGLAGTILGGTDFSESGHGALFMYSNKGVTLDLTKIPRPSGKGKFCEFRCTVGNAFTKSTQLQRTYPKADVYVLVDGVVKFERLGFVEKSGPFPVKVSLKDGDHFLTLVTTDGGDTRKGDYILMGDPVLELMLPPASTY